MHKFHRAFTIVELLVVIVIIGILATVIITAYNGISGRAKDASLSSDLAQAKKQIEAFYALNGVYPTANNCTNTAATEVCLKTTPGNTLTYTFNGNTATPPYTLTGSSSGSVVTDSDPFASSVVALLRGDGPNGSTVISDSSPLAANWSRGSNVTISDTQAKFGGTSIKVINGSSYLIPTAASSNFSFGTGDFTIELWYYTTNGWGACYLFDFNSNSATLTQPAMLLDYTVLRYYVNGTALIESPAVTTNQWVHLALTRSSGQTRLFLDGNQVGSTSSVSYNVVTPTSRPTFSSAGYNYFGSYGWDGYLDNIRITKGVARYTANFTPPTTSF